MSDPLNPEHFAFLAARAGLDPAKIGAERFEELRQGTRFLERFRSSVRRDGMAGRAPLDQMRSRKRWDE